MSILYSKQRAKASKCMRGARNQVSEALRDLVYTPRYRRKHHSANLIDLLVLSTWWMKIIVTWIQKSFPVESKNVRCLFLYFPSITNTIWMKQKIGNRNDAWPSMRRRMRRFNQRNACVAACVHWSFDRVEFAKNKFFS